MNKKFVFFKGLKMAESEKKENVDDIGFNDSELADIMSEIEELEQEFESTDGDSEEIETKEEEVVQARPEGESIVEEVSTPEVAEESEVEISDPPQDIEEKMEKVVEEIIEVAPGPVAEEEQPIPVEMDAKMPQVEEVQEMAQDPVEEEETASDESLLLNDSEVVVKTDLQSEIDAEVNGIMDSVVEEAPMPEVESTLEMPNEGGNDIPDNVTQLKVVPTPEPSQEYEIDGAMPASRLNFKIEGDLKLELGFELSGQKVELCVDKENGLTITMGNGVKFVLPMSTEEKIKKAS